MGKLTLFLLAVFWVAASTACVNPTTPGFSTGNGGYVADHRIAREAVLRSIPQTYITKARTTLRISYDHTSHGTHVSFGSFGLPGFEAGDDAKFAITTAAGDTGRLYLDDNYGNDLSQADSDWAAWRNTVRAYLDAAANATINVMMWSWCDITGHSVANYLASMETMIGEYGVGGSKIGTGAGKTRTVPVTFIFMTGHASSSGDNVGALNPKVQAQQIVDYCRLHVFFCIDYYSIDTHSMDGVYYEDANDDATSSSYGGNFYLDWQNTHAKGVDWFENRNSPGGSVEVGNHNTQHITANRKAYAFWWVLARIAGYS